MIVNGNLDVTGEVAAGLLTQGAFNVGCTLSGGTFKLTQADGSDFSTAQAARGYVVLPSITNPGRLIKLEITAATHLFEDDNGASDIVGEEFGTTAGVAWASARPFLLYAVNRDDTAANLAFAISPDPRAVLSPDTTNIGYHANPAATPADVNFFFLTATNVTATHNNKPCYRIGCLNMTKTSSDDWTVAALSGDAAQGLKRDAAFGKTYTMVVNQMGAAAGSYFKANGGTAPTYTGTNTYTYRIGADGYVDCEARFLNAAGGTAGAGAVTLLLASPYINVYGSAPDVIGVGGAHIINNGAIESVAIVAFITSSSSSVVFYYQNVAVTDLVGLTNAGQDQATREIRCSFRYRAFQ